MKNDLRCEREAPLSFKSICLSVRSGGHVEMGARFSLLSFAFDLHMFFSLCNERTAVLTINSPLYGISLFPI
jgi:hypothetical protein